MKREAVEARQKILLLGASDMDHVIAAAEAIQHEHSSDNPDLSLIRGLETAVVVCYWRPFSESNTVGHLSKKDALDSELHRDMRTWRDQAHAHTDKTSGRSAGITEIGTETGMHGLAFTESWWSTPPSDELPRIIDIARRQRDAWRAEGIELRQRL
jgi:hypothetical protein